jgi:hypothetical protein
MREASQIGPLEGAEVNPLGAVAATREAFVKHFGNDLADLQTRLVAHLKKLPYTDPFRDAPHFVAVLTCSKGRRERRTVDTFHSLPLAARWLAETREKLPAADRSGAEAAIHAFPNRLQAETFARQWSAK